MTCLSEGTAVLSLWKLPICPKQWCGWAWPLPVLSTAPWDPECRPLSALQSLNKMVPGKRPCEEEEEEAMKRGLCGISHPGAVSSLYSACTPGNHTFEEISSGSAVPTPHHARIGMGPRTHFSYHLEINLGCTHFCKYCTLGTEHSLQDNLTGYEPIAVGLRLSPGSDENHWLPLENWVIMHKSTPRFSTENMPRIWIMSPLFTVFQIFQKWFTISITFTKQEKKVYI